MRSLRRLRWTELAWALAGFVLLQLCLASAGEYAWPKLRDPAYGFGAAHLRKRLAEPERPLSIVMLGSSRVQHGLRARELEPELSARLRRPVTVFNFGMSGAGPLTSLLTMKRLLHEGIRPDVVLIEVLPTCLQAKFSDNLSGARLARRELAWLAPYLSTGDFEREWREAILVPCYGQRANLLAMFRGIWQRSVGPWGWNPYDDPPVTAESRRQGIERARAEHRQKLQDFDLGPASTALRDLVYLCRSEQITPVLVWMPEGTEFRAFYATATLERLRNYLEDLHRELGVPLLDCRHWVADEEFADSHHLLVSGARTFTNRMSDELPAQVAFHRH